MTAGARPFGDTPEERAANAGTSAVAQAFNQVDAAIRAGDAQLRAQLEAVSDETSASNFFAF